MSIDILEEDDFGVVIPPPVVPPVVPPSVFTIPPPPPSVYVDPTKAKPDAMHPSPPFYIDSRTDVPPDVFNVSYSMSSGRPTPGSQQLPPISCEPCERAEWDEEEGQMACKKIEGCVAATFSSLDRPPPVFPTQTPYTPPTCPPNHQWLYSPAHGRHICRKLTSYLGEEDTRLRCRKGFSWDDNRQECIQDKWTIGVPAFPHPQYLRGLGAVKRCRKGFSWDDNRQECVQDKWVIGVPPFPHAQPLRGFEAATTAADLLNALNFGHKKADEYKTKIVKLFQNKSLTNSIYKQYLDWVDKQRKLRQDFTKLMSDNSKFADTVAKQLGLSRDAAISKIENTSIPSASYKGIRLPDGSLGGFEVPLIVVGGWILGTVLVSSIATFGIYKAMSQDVAVAEEATNRLNLVLKTAMDATEGMPPEKRLAAVKAAISDIAGKESFKGPPPSESFMDKIKSAVAKPIGLAAAAGLIYAGVKFGLPALKKRSQKMR